MWSPHPANNTADPQEQGRDPRPEKEGTNYIEVVVDSNAVQIESRTIILQVIESSVDWHQRAALLLPRTPLCRRELPHMPRRD